VFLCFSTFLIHGIQSRELLTQIWILQQSMGSQNLNFFIMPASFSPDLIGTRKNLCVLQRNVDTSTLRRVWPYFIDHLLNHFTSFFNSPLHTFADPNGIHGPRSYFCEFKMVYFKAAAVTLLCMGASTA
jgi:hypothetical protein